MGEDGGGFFMDVRNAWYGGVRVCRTVFSSMIHCVIAALESLALSFDMLSFVILSLPYSFVWCCCRVCEINGMIAEVLYTCVSLSLYVSLYRVRPSGRGGPSARRKTGDGEKEAGLVLDICVQRREMKHEYAIVTYTLWR